MVLARSLEEWLERRREKHDAKVRAEALAEGRAEGLVEGRAEALAEAEAREARWMDWNNRRIAAEKNNEPFDEPPPNEPVPRFGSYHVTPPWE